MKLNETITLELKFPNRVLRSYINHHTISPFAPNIDYPVRFLTPYSYPELHFHHGKPLASTFINVRSHSFP